VQGKLTKNDLIVHVFKLDWGNGKNFPLANI